MRGAGLSLPPRIFEEWKGKEEVNCSYECMPTDVKQSLRDALYEAQEGLCVYCGVKLGQTFHIEHFKPQSRYKEDQLNYSNLFLSCGPEKEPRYANETCGIKKGDWYEEELSILPVYPTCSQRFSYKYDGTIYPKNPQDSQAQKMIEILNLNHKELKVKRKEVLDHIDGFYGNDISFKPKDFHKTSYQQVAYEYFGEYPPSEEMCGV